MNKSLQITITLIVGVVTFLFFLLFFFPLDALVNHYLAEMESSKAGGYRITYSKMEPSLIFDSVFYDFKLEQKVKEHYEEMFSAKQLNLGISLFSLLSQSVNSRFHAELKKGNIQGRLIYSADRSVFDIQLNDVRLDEMAVLKTYLKQSDADLNLKGTMNGNVYLSLSKTVDQSESDYAFKISNFQIKELTIMVQGAPFTIRDIILSPKDSFALFEGNLESGKLNLTNISIPGNDLEIQLKGSVNYGPQFKVRRFNMKGRFALSEKIFEQIPLLSMIQEYKTADGFFPLNMAGSPQRPSIRIGNFNLCELLNCRF